MLPSQWTGIKEKDDRKWGKEMGKENVIFHCLVGVQRDRKEKGKDGAFLLGSIIFSFLSKLRKNMRENGNEKKNKKLSPLFYSSTFNNKNMIITENASIFYPPLECRVTLFHQVF